MRLSELSIRRPILATMMSLGLVLFGVVGIGRLPVRELPDIDPPIINVQTVYTGASAAVVESQITEPIEEALSSVEGIKTLTSASQEQMSSVTIEFDLSRDIDIAAQDVRDRVARVRGQLPDEVDEPIVAKQDADANASLWVALYSDKYTTLELTTLAENVFKDKLQTVPGVSSVMFGGSKRFAIRVWLDSEKMAARGVTVLDVETAMQEQSVELPSGRVESLAREMSIETRGELKTPEEYDRLVIKNDGVNFVRLQDVGFAAVGVEDERSVARYNMGPAVGIGIVKQSKANTIDVARGIKAELERIKPLIPEGVNFAVPYDESIYVEKSIKEVWITLALAFFLVVLTIYIFLHNLRATIVPAVTIPVSIISTFGVLYLFGYSINIITMLAFVLAIGLVVDDAIVVLENIHRHIEEGMTPIDAAISGMREIGFAVIATTVALVAVFLPMAFQTSVTGRLFVEFSVAIAFGVIISTFVALTLAPMISSRVLRPNNVHAKKGLLRLFERGLDKVADIYDRQLAWSMRHAAITIIIGLLTLAGGLYFYTQLDKEFLPEEDKGRLFCMAIAPEGSTSEYTDRMVRKMESIINDTPEVEGFFSAVALARGGVGQASQGLAFIRLKEDRDRHVRDIVGGPMGLQSRFFSEIQGALAFPIIPKAIGGGWTQNFQLVLQNQDLIALNQYAQALTGKLNASGFLMNVRASFELSKPELRVNIDRDRAAALGVSVKDISRTLQVLFGGVDVNKFNRDGKEYDVIVQLARESRLSPQDLERLYIRNAQGQLIQLNNVVTYETGAGPSVINHYNRFRSATIEATPIGVPLGSAVEQVEQIIAEDLPEGFRYEWDGEAADLVETGNQTLLVMIFAILIIYMVLAAQFESLIHPLTILFTIPLAAFGAFGALWALGSLDHFVAGLPPDHALSFMPRIPAMGVNLFSQIGLVLLIGIVTKNGILLVDFANQQVEKGKSATEAMMLAGKVRLRPILMTATSTVAGILPIAIGFGAGAESRRPLGVAAVGGLTTSTFLTLFIIPVVYVLMSKLQKSKVSRASSSVVAILVLTMLASGCASTLGPKYERPEVQVPQSWRMGEANAQWKRATPKDEDSRGEWWEIFGDEVLNTLQSQAVIHNQNLQRAIANVDKARAIARVSKADFYPALDFNPSMQRSRTSQNSFTSTSAGSDSFISESYAIPFDLTYEVDVWGRVRKSFAAGWADLEASRAAYQTVLLTLTADVAQNYFILRELDTEIAIIDETIEVREQALEVVRQRAEGGVTSELDVNRARTELAKVETERVDTVRRRAEIKNALAVLCGQLPTEFTIDPQALDIVMPTIPVGVPSDLLERRPDIAEAERRVFSANAQIGIAEAAFFPSLTLTGRAGYQSVATNNLFDWESRAWSIGPSVSLPIFAGGRNKANLEAVMAEYDGTVADYRQTVLDAFADVDTALVNLNLRAEQALAQDNVVSSARETAELSLSRYKQGLITYLEVVDSERSRLDAELEAARILNQQLLSTVQLIKALGGSWDDES